MNGSIKKGQRLGKIQDAAAFNHFIWRRHEDRGAYGSGRPELMATDGTRIRRLASHPQHISFQEFDDVDASARVVSKIEDNLNKASAMLGYAVFEHEQCVSILHTGDGLAPGWMAFPYDPISAGFPTLPMRAADHPTLRLVGGFSWIEESTGPMIRGALEQRGESFKASPVAFNILDHVTSWKLLAQYGQGEDAKRIRLIDERAPILRKRPEEFRMTARFTVDHVLMREFRGDPELRIYFEVALDNELMCLPTDWLRYWFRVEVT